MSIERNDLVARKAFELWDKSGRPDGRDTDFWHHAELWVEDQDMSVQVRRRRETAAFLSTFVGAQGELLVDTTNNRVQLHDGATPGGWPAAAIGDLSARNAALNGTFVVNQRAYTSGSALAANVYAHDRWKAGAGGCTYTFTQTAPDTTITITAGTLVQAIDVGNVYATAYWLTWLGTAQARAWQGSAAGSFSDGMKIAVGGVTVNALLVTGLALGTITELECGAGTLGLVQFEAALPNAGPTRFERRHGEVTLCQRYYFSFISTPYADFFYNLVNGPGTLLGLYYPFPVAMRVAPTVAITAGTSGTFETPAPCATYVSPVRALLRGDTTASGNYAYLLSLTADAEI